MKPRAFTLIETIVVVAIIGILTALLFPTFSSHCPPSRRSQCQSNLKQIGLGFLQYAYDYNEHFPAVAASQHWPVALQPYTKDWRIFHCPSANSERDEPTTDYFFNARAGNVKLEKFENSSVSILAGDGLAAQITNAVLSALPTAWIGDSTSPANRHSPNKDLAGANYLFIDGHVKWFKPTQITLGKPALEKPTFLVK